MSLKLENQNEQHSNQKPLEFNQQTGLGNNQNETFNISSNNKQNYQLSSEKSQECDQYNDKIKQQQNNSLQSINNRDETLRNDSGSTCCGQAIEYKQTSPNIDQQQLTKINQPSCNVALNNVQDQSITQQQIVEQRQEIYKYLNILRQTFTEIEAIFNVPQPQKQNLFNINVCNNQMIVPTNNDKQYKSNPQYDQVDQFKDVPIEVSTLINQLYDLSIRSRQVPLEFRNFIGCILDQSALLEEYGSNNHQFNSKLKANLSGYRRVRGDGNCFYTAFTFQYLRIVLLRFSDQEFNKFLVQIQRIPFLVTYQNKFHIPQEIQEQLSLEFVRQLSQIRKSENREDMLFNQMSNPDKIFYGLAIIYIRNLSNEVTKEHPEVTDRGIEMTDILLEWEQDCDYNELVIAVLAESLNVYISTYYINSLSSIYQLNTYGQLDQQRHIVLILQPGHYTIGLESENS